MKRSSSKLTYSNVISTLCLVLLLGGGTAYAATQMLPKNSVGPKQLTKGAVTPVKLSKATIRALAGARGPQGAVGATGATGPAGSPGAVGTQGPPGAGVTAAPTELPHARIRLESHEQTVADNSFVRVNFDDVVEDNAGMADLTTHPTALLAPRTGLYLVAAQLQWFELEGEGRVGGAIEVPNPDGVGYVHDKSQEVYDYSNGVNQFQAEPLSEVVRLNAGQYVTLFAYQLTGATNTLTNTDDGNWLEMTYLGG